MVPHQYRSGDIIMARNNNNDSSGFGLQAIRDGLRRRTEELSADAAAKSKTRKRESGSSGFMSSPHGSGEANIDRTEAPKDEMRKYWRQFETTPIVRKPITSFASRVTEAGYFIETTKLEEEEVKKLGDWLDQCAILEGQPGRDFRLLARKAIVQREVRGTALVEVAPDKNDENRVAGLKLINPETMEAVTRPKQAILMAPDDTEDYPDAPVAESGGAAAWIQSIDDSSGGGFGISRSSGDEEEEDGTVGFRRDEIIPLARDADVGEIFGTSRIEAVSDRIDGIKQKLNDNDEAIASKAYPLWLFMFGTPEEPWDDGDIKNFMEAHEMENFHPGMKQGVRGDVNVNTISGEVADIAEYLQFDLRWIMSSMPMPMFVLGSFSSASVGQVSGVAQQRDVNRQIKEARRELEEEFTPIVRRIAEQQGIDEEDAKDITLKFGRPGESDLDINRNEQVIRYISGSQGGQTQTGEDKQNDGVITKGETPESVNNPTPDQPIAGTSEDGNPYVDIKSGEEEESNSRWSDVWDIDRGFSELQDTETEKSTIADISDQVFRKTRDRTLDALGERYSGTPQYAVAEFENIANREMNRAIREEAVADRAQNAMDVALSAVESEYDVSRTAQAQSTRFFAQNVENAVRDATEEMLRDTRTLVRRTVVEGGTWEDTRQRVELDYNDGYLRERANLIGHMTVKNAVESTKLRQFEENDDIVGVRVTNPDASTPLTRELHGTEVMFDETDVQEALLAEAGDHANQGFDPLPRAPPYHFNDTTTLEPIRRNGR